MSYSSETPATADDWVWIPDAENTFVKGQVSTVSDNNKQFTVKIPELQNKVVTLQAKDVHKCNPVQFDKCDDMASLTHLNEPSVVHNLQLRYQQDLIYTYSGLFLVAVNPYKKLNIYNKDFIKLYKDATVMSSQDSNEDEPLQRSSDIKPHIFATAEEAFQNLLSIKQDQSILVTGESGAGKTETTKKVIQYILQGASPESNKAASICFENQILEANPILESFGNATTVRNLNSSRFGKFIKINILPSTKELSGCHIDWYLLEKSRVVLQDSKERNYHVFYQFLRGAPDSLLKEFNLSRSIYEYGYLKNTNHTIPGINDPNEFKALEKAFDIMNFSDEDKKNIFRVLAVILHLGNITFKSLSDSNRQALLADSSSNSISIIAKLFGISDNAFKDSFLTSRVKAGRDVVKQQRTSAQAKFAIDALAKSLYEMLFQYLVDKINGNFDINAIQTFEQSNSIGILDIAGFEIFEKNSFEQLCINYTNEKLQQFFNHHMFVLEQSEYLKEGISWQYIDFGQELKPTIELIEGSATKRVGVFSILDEECVVPKGSDRSYLEKLLRELENKEKDVDKSTLKFKPNKIRDGFIVKHYAGEVNYNIEGWLEKNKDPLSNTIVELLSHSTNPFVQELFTDESLPTMANLSDSPVKNGRSSPKKSGMFRTVAQRHKQQLNNLMTQLDMTQPHFVRCILPNTNKRAGQFDKKLVLEQLRCNGVLEGIRIARSGYPNKMDFQSFAEYYGILSNTLGTSNSSQRTSKQACELILKELELDPEVYKVGITKLFFRNGVLAVLEKKRDEKLAIIFTDFKATCKGQLARKSFRAALAKLRASQLIIKNLKAYTESSKDPWFKMISQLKPMIANDESTQTYYMNQVKILEDEIATLKSKKSEDQSKLSEELTILKKENDANHTLLKQKESQLDDFKKKSVRLEKRVADLKESVDRTASELEAERLELTEKVNQLSEQNKEHAKAAAPLKEEVRVLKSAVSEKEHSISKLESKLATVDPELENKLAEANMKLSASKTEVERLKNSLEKSNGMVDEFKKALKAKESELLSLNKKMSDNTIKKTAYQESMKKLEAKESQIALLNKQLSENKATKADLDEMKKKLEEKTVIADSTDKLKLKYKQLKHDFKENKELLDSKIREEIEFDKGKQKHEKELADLNETINDMKKELDLEKRTSQKLSVQARSLKLDNDKLAKSKKSNDVKMAEMSFRVSRTGPLPFDLPSDAAKLREELALMQTRLASEAYENRQLRAQLKKLGATPESLSRSGSVIGNPSNASVVSRASMRGISDDENTELAIERAAVKRLEKLNVELQKDLLQQKNSVRESRGTVPIEVDYKTKYQFAEMQIKNLEDKLAIHSHSAFGSSARTPLQDSTRSTKNLENVLDNPYLDKDSISMKQENLRLSSRLNEAQTKLKRMQLSTDSTFMQQEQLVQLKSKVQVLENRSLTLQESVEFYKTRADNYYSKIEAAEVAVQSAKRAELLVKNELTNTKQRLAKAQEEFKNSDLTVARLNSTIREIERDLADKVFALRKLQEQYEAIKNKYESDEEFRASASSSQNKSKNRELEMLNEELVKLMNKETELNKMVKNINLQLEVTKKESRSLKFTNSNLVKEKDQVKKMLGECMEKNDSLITEKQEHLMKLNTLSNQVNALKTTNTDLVKERDSLLESKRELELKVSNISQEFEKHLAKVKEDASNAVSVVQLSSQLKESKSQVMELKMKVKDYEDKFNDYDTRLQTMREDSLMVIEENKALVKFNKNLKTKIEQMEDDFQDEKSTDSKHWTTRIEDLEEKLMRSNATKREEDQKLYNLKRSVKDLESRNDIQEQTVQRYKHEIQSLEDTVNRLDNTIQALQKQDTETQLKFKRAQREVNTFKEQNLLLEKELLDWRTAA